MYAITGITGKVGGALARTLLDNNQPVRAILRDELKAAAWKARGCDVALAEMEDAPNLAKAFEDAEGVFILPPSEFDPEPGFPEARRVIEAVTKAVAAARPGRVVCVGWQAAALLCEEWVGTQIVELEGPARVSPNDLARVFAQAVGHPVRVEIVPRESWEKIFRSQGARNPLPRMRMLDGFNEGWIKFREQGQLAVKGTTTLKSVIGQLVNA